MNNQVTFNHLLQIFILMCGFSHCMAYWYLHKITSKTATKIDVARLSISLQVRTASLATSISIVIIKTISSLI